MSELFLKIINMSISGGFLVLVVLLLRLVLKRAPKWVNVLLWGIVAARLICPFSLESTVSLLPSAETISPNIMTDKEPAIQTGVSTLDSIINPIIKSSFSPEPGDSANPLQIWIPILCIIWVSGIAILLLYITISYVKLKKKLREAVILRDNIYQSEQVVAPFVLGFMKPKIYLPYCMEEKNLSYVIAHEQAHIRRKDHWGKLGGFLLLTLHWFNPLMWIAYVLLCRDIELACDEKVIKAMDNENRADYTQALLNCSVNHRSIAVCPLAFGEVGVKERVKNVMKYKKPALWLVVAAVLICVVVAVCFLTNPEKNHHEELLQNDHFNGEVQITEEKSDSGESFYWLSAKVQRTKLTSLSKTMEYEIKREWDTYNSMSEEQRLASSHMWGTIYVETDTWEEIEEVLGVSIDNPLESVEWIHKTSYIGMERENLPHVHTTVYTTQSTDNKVDNACATAGYEMGDVRITLSTTISVNSEDITAGFSHSGDVTYVKTRCNTASGAPVLVVSTYEAENFFDSNAYWVEGNVLYGLRVFGDTEDEEEIQSTLERLLEEI